MPVRQAAAAGDKVVGALNNDMIGFAGDHRLDDTIRYSNSGLRDVQHAAAFLFTNLIAYDAKSATQGTDTPGPSARVRRHRRRHRLAADPRQPALSPAARRPRDRQHPAHHRGRQGDGCVNHADGVEPVARDRSSGNHEGRRRRGDLDATAEKNVTAYVVRHRGDGQPRDTRVTTPRATLSNARAGDEVWVKAINARGMEGWDWQRVIVK